MNYKQQIEQKKLEIYKREMERGPSGSYLEGYYNGMEAMMEIANTWIPVVDRLPEEAGLYLCKCKSNRLGFYFEIVFFNKVWRSDKVIGWRPIE